MPNSFFPFWKEAPFARLLPPFIAGILLQWYAQTPAIVSWSCLAISLAALLAYLRWPAYYQFSFRWTNGILIHALLLSLGALLTKYKDSAETAETAKQFFTKQVTITVTILERLSEKKHSFKTTASILRADQDSAVLHGGGKLIIYFKKPAGADSLKRLPAFGDVISFHSRPQPVSNFANAGGFDYRQYCARAGIHFQVYLRPREFVIKGSESKWFARQLLEIRQWTMDILRAYISGKKEQGLAEALLIGYKDDLDKSLLQSYNNAGVVHVIAISGLHLGLIYTILRYLCLPLTLSKKARWAGPCIQAAGLWLFSLLAGAAPSVLRSAVMFSSILLGQTISRKTLLINNLAASAFFLLCYHPYWLWDTGFQLSYAALAGIILFMRPVYRLAAFKNKMLDSLWQLLAATIAAQALTLPLTLYYFHQFPMLFMAANIIAVPLSGLILTGELVLCAVSWIPPVAKLTGVALELLIKGMNVCMEHLERMPFSLWKGLYISLPQAILLYAIIFTAAHLLFAGKKAGNL